MDILGSQHMSMSAIWGLRGHRGYPLLYRGDRGHRYGKRKKVFQV